MGIECVITGVVFFQAEDGIRDLVRSRGLGDVYKRQLHKSVPKTANDNVVVFLIGNYGLNISHVILPDFRKIFI